MPLPIAVLAGLPWLAGVLGGLFASLVSFLAKYLTKRLAIVVAVIASILALTIAFFAAIQALLAGLAVAVPVPITDGLSLFLPTNTVGCITAVITAYTIRYIYRWNVAIIKMKLI